MRTVSHYSPPPRFLRVLNQVSRTQPGKIKTLEFLAVNIKRLQAVLGVGWKGTSGKWVCVDHKLS